MITADAAAWTGAAVRILWILDAVPSDSGDGGITSVTFRRPPTAQEAVLTELRQLIVSGELAPGEQIVQETLATRFGVSRVPVREALKTLQGEGQVRYSPHHGYFVAKLELSELVEVYRIRELMETEAIQAAVPRLTQEDLTRLTEAVADMAAASAAGDIGAMTEANRLFHFTLFEASGLPRFVRIVRQMWDSSDPYRSIYFGEPAHRALVDEEHRQIVDAARDKDSDRLVQLMNRHRANAVAELRKVLATAE